MIYVGTYHDHNREIRLDLNSMATKANVSIHKFYDDMQRLGIVDGFNAAHPSDEQLDELNQSECDIIMLDDEDDVFVRYYISLI